MSKWYAPLAVSGLAALIMIGAIAWFIMTRATPSPSASTPTSTQTPSSRQAEEAAPTVATDPLESVQGWPTIFVNIVAHNEDNISPKHADYRTTEPLFQRQRLATINFATMLKTHNVKFNWQSDWDFLLGVSAFDDGAGTNGKNMVRYLFEDLGVSVDPHSHEKAGYNYADIAYLMELLGVQASGVVGGLVASPPEDSKLEYLWGLTHGSNYPAYEWRPELLWGGGTSGHVDEEQLWVSGVWHPQDNEHFDVHDPEAPLPVVGHYQSSWEGLDKLLALQAAGELTAGKIYTVSIFSRQNDFSDAYTAEFAARLATYDDETADGRLVWTTIQETYEAWVERYGSEPNIFHWEE